MADLITEKDVKDAERWLSQREFKWLRTFSRFVAGAFDRTFGWITPNHVTLLGALLCLPAMWLYKNDQLAACAVVLTFAFLTDFVDGALARFQMKHHKLRQLAPEEEEKLSLWARVNRKGNTHLGMRLDPFVDKVRYFIVLFVIGYGYVESWLIWASLGCAIALTLIRPVMRYFKLGTGASSKLGKIKIFVEIAALMALFFIPHTTDIGPMVCNTLVGLALLGGLASLSGHLFLFIRRFNRPKKAKPPRLRL